MNAQIKEIIKRYQFQTPVNVIALANNLGIKVYEAPGDPSLSGKIVKASSNQEHYSYEIIVNKGDSIQRKRFTIAHEIAHYILHKDKIGDGLVDDALYRSGLSNKEEVEANKLAAEILMPWHLINAAFEKGLKTIPDLATEFDVSPSAMSIRLGVPA